MPSPARLHDGKMDSTVLYASLRHRRPRLGSDSRRFTAGSYESWLCNWRPYSRRATYPKIWQLLFVGSPGLIRQSRVMLTRDRSCIISFALFSVALFTLSQLSTQNSSTTAYIVAIFVNGLCTGAALNYTLAHILHLSLPENHFIVTALLATFRGFAGSFGSAIGGGIFARVLQPTLEQGFKDKGLHGKKELIRQLLGSPALVSSLKGDDKEVAITGYVAALQGLFVAASGLAMTMVLVQAGAGWHAPVENIVDEASEAEYGQT
jgi:hypothetical protein